MYKLFRRHPQMSEAPITVLFLTLSGGLQDSYSYIDRDKVFANAQTGNIVLMSQHFFSKDPAGGLRYLFPLIFFAIGIFAAERICAALKYRNGLIHWRQVVILLEIAILFVVGLLPQEFNTLANALTSLCCAMQVQSFRKISGFGYASTMCIGNMRAGVESFSIWLRTKKPEHLYKALHYFAVIFIFAIGAGLGSVLSVLMDRDDHIIWFSCGFLLVAFFIMMIRDIEEDRRDSEEHDALHR